MFEYTFPTKTEDFMEEADLEADWQKCPGCKGKQSKYSTMRTRKPGE